MIEAITNFFQTLRLPNEALLFFVSMVPIIELRGAVPLGVFLNMNPWVILCISVLGNMLPIPFIIWCARPVVNFFLSTKLLRPLGEWLENKVRKNSGKVKKYETLGLLLFVAIPLPGTGGWTGALLAALMDLQMKKALPSIFFGIVIAGLIMLFGSTAVDFILSLFL